MTTGPRPGPEGVLPGASLGQSRNLNGNVAPAYPDQNERVYQASVDPVQSGGLEAPGCSRTAPARGTG